MDKARHVRMIALVTQMLDLSMGVSDHQGRYHHEKLQDAKLEHEKTLLLRQIKAMDKQIDMLVSELFGLTEMRSK